MRKADEILRGQGAAFETTEARRAALSLIESAQREAWNEAVEEAALKAGHHAGPGIANTIRSLYREEG